MTVYESDVECTLECDYLTTDDYITLLWTSLSEIPGIAEYLLQIHYEYDIVDLSLI